MAEDDRQRRVALAHVEADRLAERRFARGDVEQVVDHLEGQADVAAAARHRLDDGVIGAGQVGGGARADLEQRGRLARDDLEVVVEASPPGCGGSGPA